MQRERLAMLHMGLFPKHDCDGELVELPERSNQTLTVASCAKCWTEFSGVADDGRWVKVVYPGMKGSMDYPT